MNEHTWSARGLDMTRQTEARAGSRTIAVTALYWLELQTLKLDFRKLKQTNRSGVDSWWVSTGGKARGPCRFTEILKLVLDGAGTVAAVPESSANENPVPWRTISYQAWWSNPRTARLWTIAFWLTAAFFGWALVCLITPFSFQRPVEFAYWLLVVCATIRTARLRGRLTS